MKVKILKGVKITRQNFDLAEWSDLDPEQQYDYEKLKTVIDNERSYQERQAARVVRAATPKELNKSRGAVQTRYRRAVLGKLDSDCVADKKSNCYEKHGVKSKASKEKRYNKSDDPAGFSNKAQGAGNVVGCKELRERL